MSVKSHTNCFFFFPSTHTYTSIIYIHGKAILWWVNNFDSKVDEGKNEKLHLFSLYEINEGKQAPPEEGAEKGKTYFSPG